MELPRLTPQAVPQPLAVKAPVTSLPPASEPQAQTNSQSTSQITAATPAGDQLHAWSHSPNLPRRGPVQAVLAFLHSDPPPLTPADTTWAQELLGRTANGYHPTPDEMGRYRAVAKANPALPAVTTLAEIAPVMAAIFPRLDHNHNGFLGDDELKAAIRNPAFQGSQAVALATLLKLNHSIEKLSWNEWKQTGGVHADDLSRLAKKASKDKPSKWTLYVEGYVFNQSTRLKQVDQRLFPQGIESIRPDHIRQGDYGTCTLLAAAGAMASSPAGKQAILKMIAAKPDGSFEVRFPNEKPLTVARPTDTELILHANAGPDGLWLSVLEKAFVAKMEQKLAGKTPDQVEAAVNEGIYLSEGIRLLTGHPAAEGNLPATPLPQLRDFVAQTVQEGRILLVSLDPDSPQAQGKALKEKTRRSESVYADGLVGQHAYSVIGYDPATDTVTLHNPWGNTEYGSNGKAADGVDDGTFTLKLAELQQLFSDIAWQARE